jgi:hypothetical protein
MTLTLYELQTIVDRFIGLYSQIIPTEENRARLVYRGATGTCLFRLRVYCEKDGGWRVGGIEHTLSGGVEWEQLMEFGRSDATSGKNLT